jgi:uncharacterized membrane protein YgcG
VKVTRVLGVVGGLVLVLLFGEPASAAPAESIPDYDVRIQVQADGLVHVRETITYDFGGQSRHGIFRTIPVRTRYDDTRDRVYPVDSVTVTMDGGPVAVKGSSQGGSDVFRIGDPDHTITGRHTYTIEYTMAGAVTAFPDHQELYWNAIGTEWTVPIDTATATVTGPAPVQRIECYTGPGGSRSRCADSTMDAAAATFHQTHLGNGSGLTVVLAFPVGSVAHPGPLLTERRTWASAFQATPATVGGAVGLALIGVAAALAIGWRVGRDRYYLGQLPGLVPVRGEPVVEQRKPIIGAPPVSVEFVPPENIRPGQVGTLIDERADVVDVTATIVDFAVRRHLKIRELRPPGRKTARDWELTKLTDGDPKFLRYERTLFRALFDDGDSVRLSELKRDFAPNLAKVRSQLYADMVRQGWYRQSPARTRNVARTVAVLILLGSLGITAVLGLTTHAALVGTGLVAGALALLAVSGRFPARTGKGSAALARTQGFRLYVATAEAEQIRFQEREQIFSEYLPYAIAFGLAERWAGIFAKLGGFGPDGASDPYWYTGTGAWNAMYFNDSMTGFNAAAAGAMASGSGLTSGSSSGFSGGGFSGGGAGGGGGGSW